MTNFNLLAVDPSWQDCIQRGLAKVDSEYLTGLCQSTQWLPGPEKIFNAFSLPLEKVNYILFGESPYPRAESANGHAFWDANVKELWSSTGFTKTVNRATSLRNILKMLLIAEGLLEPQHTTQQDIANISKKGLVQTGTELFTNFTRHGILLLNATPVLQPSAPLKDARMWLPFMQELLECTISRNQNVKFILFGKIAQTIDQLFPDSTIERLYAEHPYNLSFIHNPEVIRFFKPLHLLRNLP